MLKIFLLLWKNYRLLGFNQLEMYGEPDEIDLKYINDIILSFNFKIIGITGMWGKISPLWMETKNIE